MLGGETLRDFALALLVGIVVGTYSSVFTATPLAVRFEGLAGGGRPGPVASPSGAGVPRRRRPAGHGVGVGLLHRPSPSGPAGVPRPSGAVALRRQTRRMSPSRSERRP